MSRLVLDVDPAEAPAVIVGLIRAAATNRRAAEQLSRTMVAERRGGKDVRSKALQVTDLLADAAGLEAWADAIEAATKERTIDSQPAQPLGLIVLGGDDDGSGPEVIDGLGLTLVDDGTDTDDEAGGEEPPDETAAATLAALQSHPEAVGP